jgi:hypothetical protein
MNKKGRNIKVIVAAFAMATLSFMINGNALATVYFVSTDGSDANAGTSLSLAFKSVPKAIAKAVAGDVIYIRAGTYSYTSTIKITVSGTSDNPISMLAYPGDSRPLLDFSGMEFGSSNRGILLSGSYWYIKGIRIKGAGDNGMNISGGNYNTIEFCDFFENRDGGCQLGGGAKYNRIINCDSYHNADYGTGITTNGGNADGFSPKIDVGTGNYFYGCRAYYNSDDGWDGFMKTTLEDTTTLENCWTWHNGYYRLSDRDTTTGDMNGNGFKMGSDGYIHNMILKNCLSFNNKAKGFDQNHNSGFMTLYNCTSKSNGGKNFSIYEAVNSGKAITIENCISYEASNKSILSTAIVATNSWDSEYSITSADFTSTDSTGVSGSRKADGRLPDVGFMHLASGSEFIDTGTVVGIPYNGSKPDLGCFETGNSLAYTLAISIGDGQGVLSLSGSDSYTAGTIVSVTAAPEDGYVFYNWKSDTTVIGTAPAIRITVDADKTITANFKVYTATGNTSKIQDAVSFNVWNAANNEVKVEFNLETSATVNINLYSIQGYLVRNIAAGKYSAGKQNISFNKEGLASGVYICTMVANGKSYSRKLVIVN